MRQNRGHSDSAVFFLTKNYWRDLCPCQKGAQTSDYLVSGRRKSSMEEKDYKEFDYNQMTKYDTVKSEKQRVIRNEKLKTTVHGMRIMGLSKIFPQYPFGIKSSRDVHAVKEVYLQADDCELLTILGHNGAGKSTLINVLTGLLSASKGRAFIAGMDISREMSSIQSIMGVCPQFDTLWEQLTAYEHFKMFCLMKGVRESSIEWEIDRRLKEVGLLEYKHARIGTYSGGMKRRVSLAISVIGNPRIIFMDEPTTGMDPQTRRTVWEMIKEMKQNRLVILTTHAMQEADALSDRIAVMAEGSIKCIGTPLYLKNNFSDGYRLSLVTQPDYVEFVRAGIRQIIPNCSIIDEKGGSILVSIPVLNLPELKSFFSIMDKVKVSSPDRGLINKEFASYILDWGLSHATLEEVFIKITRSQEL